MPGVYAITGGLGGLGLRTAAMLIDRDAAGVVLSSRSGRVIGGGKDANAQLASLCAAATVRVSSTDVGDKAAHALVLVSRSGAFPQGTSG